MTINPNQQADTRSAAPSDPDQLERVMARLKGTAPAEANGAWGREPSATERAEGEREQAAAKARAAKIVAHWKTATGRTA